MVALLSFTGVLSLKVHGKPPLHARGLTPGVHSQSRDKFLKQEKLVSFCNTAGPQSKLEDKEAWLENGSLNYNTILRLGFAKGRDIR